VQRGHRYSWLVSLGVAAVVSAMPVGVVADVSPPGRLMSNYETASGSGRWLARDCGYSHPRPNDSDSSIWLFCDTPIVDSSGHPIGFGFIPGSTAAVGPSNRGKVPTDLSEIPMAGTPIEPLPSSQAPHQFLSTPSGVSLPKSNATCSTDPSKHQYAASWITGVTREPSTVDSSQLLISFTDVCVSNGSLTLEHFGLAEYKGSTNTITDETQVFNTSGGQSLPAQWALASPIFSGGYLYLLSAVCTAQDGFGGCTTGSVFLARTPASRSSWEQSSAYQFLTSSGWQKYPNSAPLLSVIPGAEPIYAVSVDDYSSVGQGLDLIEETSIAGNFRVWTASSPDGTWKQKTSGQVPCTAGAGALNLCRALIGHPELSTTSQLLLSFLDPGDIAGQGHVRVAAQSW
jgi:hypothetical protein